VEDVFLDSLSFFAVATEFSDSSSFSAVPTEFSDFFFCFVATDCVHGQEKLLP
jgi:hypothetical protein